MKRLLLVFWLVIGAALNLCAQGITTDVATNEDGNDEPSFVPMVKVGKVLNEGDSIPYVQFNDVYIYPQQVFASKKQQRAYNNLVRNVKKVLPIAKEANAIIIETYEYMQTLPNEKARQAHMAYVEKSIM